MDLTTIFVTLKESLFVIVTFLFFLSYAAARGKQSIVNLIFGLYFALLISIKFPFYGRLLAFANGDSKMESIIMIGLFSLFTILATLLLTKFMPQEYDETTFEFFVKKVFLAIAATILVMAYSFHVLPITEFITPSTPIQSLFSSADNFFWWLLLPLVGLYFL